MNKESTLKPGDAFVDPSTIGLKEVSNAAYEVFLFLLVCFEFGIAKSVTNGRV
jgi:hypothetical protein